MPLLAPHAYALGPFAVPVGLAALALVMLGVVVSARNIRQRKRTEETLRRASADTELLLSSLPSLLIVVTPEGIVNHWNAAAEAMLGLPRAAVLHRPLAACELPWDFPGISDGIARCHEGHLIQLEDIWFRHASGYEGFLGLTLIPIREAPGTAASCLIFGADVTQRKLTQRALALQNAELLEQQQAMQRLLEDVQATKARLEGQGAELLEANTQLKQMAALKDEFVAKVSHELRTPLTSVKEGLSLMLDGALGETTADQQDFLKTMDADLDRLADLINNMLDLSKIEAGRMRLARGRVSTQALIESVMRSTQTLMGHRTVCKDFIETPPVFADANRLLQVLTNLVSNAIKFTPDDGTITFHVNQHDGMATIAVQDTGAGIAPEDLPKLFQKFSQVGPRDVNRPRGTGLGLAVCKELTELHGGRVDVASTVGRGTTFTIRLPVYSDTLAFAESLRELVEQRGGKQETEQTVSVIAIQAGHLLTADGRPPHQQLEPVVEDMKRHLHRGDIVLALDPSWIVVLAVIGAEGIQAIVKRLQSALAYGARLQFGAAVYPADGVNAAALLSCATARAGQPADSLESGSRANVAPPRVEG